MNKEIKIRSISQNIKYVNRDDESGKYIEGYFAVFNQRTQLYPGMWEEIDPAAFNKSIKDNDIRCLFNHNSDVVLGRSGNGTLSLRADEYGLYGSVKINEDDKQAMDIYARVKRGDIVGCSFGFYPISEEYRDLESGDFLCRILEADTAEVSICPFPAYAQTEINARKALLDNYIVDKNNKTREEKIKTLREKWSEYCAKTN